MPGFWRSSLRPLVLASRATRDVWTGWLVTQELQRVNDQLLRDIGVARGDIDAFVDEALAKRRAELRALDQIEGGRKADLHASRMFHARH